MEIINKSIVDHINSEIEKINLNSPEYLYRPSSEENVTALITRQKTIKFIGDYVAILPERQVDEFIHNILCFDYVNSLSDSILRRIISHKHDAIPTSLIVMCYLDYVSLMGPRVSWFSIRWKGPVIKCSVSKFDEKTKSIKTSHRSNILRIIPCEVYDLIHKHIRCNLSDIEDERVKSLVDNSIVFTNQLQLEIRSTNKIHIFNSDVSIDMKIN
jgi:hypothetical protein